MTDISRNMTIAAFLLCANSAQGLAQDFAQPSPVGVPTALVAPIVTYEQGMAHIFAQDAARPKAVRPKGPDDAAVISSSSNRADSTPIQTPPMNDPQPQAK